MCVCVCVCVCVMRRSPNRNMLALLRRVKRTIGFQHPIMASNFYFFFPKKDNPIMASNFYLFFASSIRSWHQILRSSLYNDFI
jgi:hypothetical protein